jgi:uncharacterized protein
MDSPAQGVTGIPVARVLWDAESRELTLEVSAIAARFSGTLVAEGSLEGAWHQGGLTFPLALGRMDPGEAVAAPARPQHPTPPFPYRAQEVVIPNAAAGIELAGTLTLPDPARHGPGPFPGVVLVTGSGAQDRDETILGHRPFLVLADHLTRAGVAVLRHDDRGVGGSGGDFASATTLDLAGDAAAALDWLRNHPEVDAGSTGVLGHSEGGLIALLLATGTAGWTASPEELGADHPGAGEGGLSALARDPAFVILLGGPGLPGEEILPLQIDALGAAAGIPPDQRASALTLQRSIQAVLREEPDPELRRTRLESILRDALRESSPMERAALGIPAGDAQEEAWIAAQLSLGDSPWFRTFLLLDPRGSLEVLQTPLLALFGELDLQVPPEPNRQAMVEALEMGGHRDATLQLLPGLNHLFQEATTGLPAEYGQIEETLNPALLEAVTRWILERFGG